MKWFIALTIGLAVSVGAYFYLWFHSHPAFAIGALLIALPLFVFWLRQSDEVFGHPGDPGLANWHSPFIGHPKSPP